MKVTFHRTGSFCVTFNGYETEIFKSLDEAVSYISDNFHEGEIETWEIVDLDTDEVIMTFEDEKDSSDWEPDVDETGFNPYLGDYDFDC